METYVVRVWMPDRPGALGQVASRIGAVGGDVVGIDILERGAGRAIDELVVQLPEASLLALLLNEIAAVDGVDVEDVRPAAESLRDPHLAALESAAMLVAAPSTEDLLHMLVQHVHLDFSAEWVAVVEPEEREIHDGTGDMPPVVWLEAFIEGSRASARVIDSETGPEDIVWAPLPTSGLNLVLGRGGRPLRARERRQLAALARIADTRYVELVAHQSRDHHPSGTS